MSFQTLHGQGIRKEIWLLFFRFYYRRFQQSLGSNSQCFSLRQSVLEVLIQNKNEVYNGYVPSSKEFRSIPSPDCKLTGAVCQFHSNLPRMRRQML